MTPEAKLVCWSTKNSTPRFGSFRTSIERRDLDIAREAKMAPAQRKNLLQAAFAGQRVPQDPIDEPASELLARIRAARETSDSGDKVSKRGRRAKETALSRSSGSVE